MAAANWTITDLQPWIDVQFARASGPGGQNVNKVNTRATVLFDFEQCPLLTDTARQKIRRSLNTRLSADGRLRVVSQAERTQPRNRAAAEQRLLELLRETLRPRKTRRPTKPTAASRRRRLTEKRQHSEKKDRRRPPD